MPGQPAAGLQRRLADRCPAATPRAARRRTRRPRQWYRPRPPRRPAGAPSPSAIGPHRHPPRRASRRSHAQGSVGGRPQPSHRQGTQRSRRGGRSGHAGGRAEERGLLLVRERGGRPRRPTRGIAQRRRRRSARPTRGRARSTCPVPVPVSGRGCRPRASPHAAACSRPGAGAAPSGSSSISERVVGARVGDHRPLAARLHAARGTCPSAAPGRRSRARPRRRPRAPPRHRGRPRRRPARPTNVTGTPHAPSHAATSAPWPPPWRSIRAGVSLPRAVGPLSRATTSTMRSPTTTMRRVT